MTGVQTCALPISALLATQAGLFEIASGDARLRVEVGVDPAEHALLVEGGSSGEPALPPWAAGSSPDEAPGREREITPLFFAAGALLLALKAVFA